VRTHGKSQVADQLESLNSKILVAVCRPRGKSGWQRGKVAGDELGAGHELLELVQPLLPHFPVLVLEHLTELIIQLAAQILSRNKILHGRISSLLFTIITLLLYTLLGSTTSAGNGQALARIFFTLCVDLT